MLPSTAKQRVRGMRRPKRAVPQASAKKPGADCSEWRLLSEAYHYVLKQSPSPENAKIAINEQYRNGKLRLRCTLREHRARPKLELPNGESPPKPLVTPDYEISPTERFSSFDWERSYATRRDPISKSLFEYEGITVNWDEVLTHWPPVKAPPEAATPSARKSKPEELTRTQWLVVKILDAIEQQERIDTDMMRMDPLLDKIRPKLPSGTTVSERTLRTVRAWRRRNR
jgi:hypothetical protein